MAKQKTNLVEFDIWVVRCLLCDLDLATEDGQRPPYSVQRDHLATHSVDYRTCEPTKDGYHCEEQALPEGGSMMVSQSTYAEGHGRGREVMLAVRSFGSMTKETAFLLNQEAEDEATVAPEDAPGASTLPQEARKDPDRYEHTDPPPSVAPGASQSVLEAMLGVAEPSPAQVLGFTPVDVTCGGPGGPYGGYSIYAPAYKLGTTYTDPDDYYDALSRLLNQIEGAHGIECVVGDVTHTGKATAWEMITDDERVPVLPKEKAARKSKPRYQGEEWYGQGGEGYV